MSIGRPQTVLVLSKDERAELEGLSVRRIEAVIVKTRERAPAGATYWSSRNMARACDREASREHLPFLG